MIGWAPLSPTTVESSEKGGSFFPSVKRRQALGFSSSPSAAPAMGSEKKNLGSHAWPVDMGRVRVFGGAARLGEAATRRTMGTKARPPSR